MEGHAKNNFNATADDELGLKKGEIIKIINFDEDKNWYKAEICGKEGLVPKNYIEMEDYKFFFGYLKRAEAESLLLAKKTGSISTW